MKGQELKDFVKSNHKEFGGSMSNQQIANQAMVSNARVSQIKSEIITANKKALDELSAAGQEMDAVGGVAA